MRVDDVTPLVRAQKVAAWREDGRRLATKSRIADPDSTVRRAAAS
jgi:nitrogen fixation/metabolism regulation signal transduction histidine kinase